MSATLTESFELDPTCPRAALRPLGSEEFEELVHAYHRRILRLFLGWFGDPELAENLTQECFLRAYRRRGSFRGEAEVATWLTRIAINLAHDQRRSRFGAFWRGIRPLAAEDDSPDPAPDPVRVLTARERWEALRRRLETLPPRQQEVFRLRYLEEMPLASIAEILGLSVGTVKAHLFRAVAALRRGEEDR